MRGVAQKVEHSAMNNAVKNESTALTAKCKPLLSLVRFQPPLLMCNYCTITHLFFVTTNYTYLKGEIKNGIFRKRKISFKQ